MPLGPDLHEVCQFFGVRGQFYSTGQGFVDPEFHARLVPGNLHVGDRQGPGRGLVTERSVRAGGLHGSPSAVSTTSLMPGTRSAWRSMADVATALRGGVPSAASTIERTAGFAATSRTPPAADEAPIGTLAL